MHLQITVKLLLLSFSILLDKDGFILEGSRSNIFWVTSNTLFTRKDKVLPGVTRKTVIKNSPFPVKYDKLNILDIKRLDELFLTNSGSGIIPVTKIDSTILSKGSPGPITLKLLQLLKAWSKKTLK